MNSQTLGDQAARERINRAHAENLLVEAGAGSGKTHEMATRMATGIATGAYQVEHLAAVTFTVKAAAELRGRFQLALEEELAALSREQPQDPARVERVRAALSKLERFFAGTIHAFCAQLLRERPVEAGVSPGFVELDEVDDRLVREKAWRDFRVQAKTTGNPHYFALSQAGVKASDLDQAFQTVCLFDEVTFPAEVVGAPDVKAPLAALDQFWKDVQKRLPHGGIDANTTCKTQQKARGFERMWRVLQKKSSRPEVLAELLGHWDTSLTGSNFVLKWWSDDQTKARRLRDEIQGMHAALKDAVIAPYLATWRQHLYAQAMPLLEGARQHAVAERRRLNALSYNDLLQLTAAVLRTNASVRRALGEKYRWLFVDEFQDTDPVQAEIMFLMASDSNSSRRGGMVCEDSIPPVAPADWRTIPLRPGALFVVGDPKQSIYRFRRADIDIYNEVRARLEGTGGVVALTTNFRSVPALCEWANQVFAEQFPAEPTAHSPKFQPLEPNPNSRQAGPVVEAGWSAKDQSRPAIATDSAALRESVVEAGWSAKIQSRLPAIVTLTTPETVDRHTVAAHEAEAIARYIRAEVDAGRRKYSAFLILTRKRKNLSLYASALEDLRVPVEVSGAGAFGQSEEVKALALLLRALADPQDAVSLVGVLRGPLFGLSDRVLFTYHEAGGRFSIFAPNTDDPLLHSRLTPVRRVAEALAFLRSMHRATQVLPAGAAVERILERTGYLALAGMSPGGVEAGDLLHALDRVRQVFEKGGGLVDAVEALESDELDSSEVESLPLEPGQTNVVRVMNLHKAKGLEADVVFLADPLSGVKERVDVRIVREGTGAHGYFKVQRSRGENRAAETVAEPVGWATYEAEERAYLRAEETRLLYVAATRARNLLVVCRYAKDGAGARPWAVFDSHLVGVPELKIPSASMPPRAEKVSLTAAAIEAAEAAQRAAHEDVCTPSWTASSPSAVAHTVEAGSSVGPVAAGLPPVDHDWDRQTHQTQADAEAGWSEMHQSSLAGSDPTSVLTADTPSRRADRGLAWGTLVHGLLEHAMRHLQATDDDLRRLAMWLTVDEPDLRPVIADAIATVRGVAKLPFWAEATASPERHEETPFGIRTEQDGVPNVVTGTIDLTFKTPDGWRIVDYKTDAGATTEELRARYQAQLKAYEAALGRFVKGAISTDIAGAR